MEVKISAMDVVMLKILVRLMKYFSGRGLNVLTSSGYKMVQTKDYVYRGVDIFVHDKGFDTSGHKFVKHDDRYDIYIKDGIRYWVAKGEI